MSPRIRVLSLVLAGVLVASVFYLRALARKIFIEIPSLREDIARTRLTEVALQPATGNNETVTLYFPSLDKKQLLGEKRQMALAASDADRIHQILLALVEGPHKDNSAALPVATEVRAVFLAPGGTAFLDFSSDLLAHLTPGIENETLTVYSIVNTLASNIPAVKRVKILIQGQEVETLDGHADLSDAIVANPSLNAQAP
jgi:spore germination protein GerM